MLVIALIMAAVVPLRGPRDGAIRPAPLAAHQRDTAELALTVGAGRTVRLLSLGGPGGDRLLSRIGSNMAAAVDDVAAFWGHEWSRDVVVVVTGAEWQFRALAAGPGGGDTEGQWADIAAVTVADRVDPAHRVAVGQRIVLAPGAADMSDQALRIVLAHELFHYATRADTALDAPRWLTEGVADFVARPRVAAAYPPLPTALPSDAELDTPGARRARGYDEAWWFAAFVADTYGTATLRELYRSACGVGHADPATVARDLLGTDLGGLLVRWQRWLTR